MPTITTLYQRDLQRAIFRVFQTPVFIIVLRIMEKIICVEHSIYYQATLSVRDCEVC